MRVKGLGRLLGRAESMRWREGMKGGTYRLLPRVQTILILALRPIAHEDAIRYDVCAFVPLAFSSCEVSDLNVRVKRYW